MRILILALNILSSSLLLMQSSQVLAASRQTTDKVQTSTHKKIKNNHTHTKKQKNKKTTIDVWERIRLGMKITSTTGEITNKSNSSIPNPSFPIQLKHENSPKIEQINEKSLVVKQTLDQATPKKSLQAINIQKELEITAAKFDSNDTPAERRLKRHAGIISSEENNQEEKNLTTQTRVHTQIGLSSATNKPEFSASEKLLNLEHLVKEESIDSNSLDKPNFNYNVEDITPKPLDLQETIKSDRINKHIAWYTQHSDYLHQVTERARPYLYHIVESLNQHKLPYELALLPIIESAYQPTALSPKSAAGLWQFIPSTGQDFDLYQTESYDSRLDITTSTQAAMRYLAFLNQHFNGDWLLSLAAYNCGLGTVDNAIIRNKEEGIETDYWSLRLPEETQEYVPRFLALSNIFANPDAHGLKLSSVRNEPYFVKIKIDRKHEIEYLAKKELKEIAQLANLSYEEFNELNPGYLNPKLPDSGPFTLLLPSENANQFNKHLKNTALFIINESPTISENLFIPPNELVKIGAPEFKFLTLFNDPSDSKLNQAFESFGQEQHKNHLQ